MEWWSNSDSWPFAFVWKWEIALFISLYSVPYLSDEVIQQNCESELAPKQYLSEKDAKKLPYSMESE